MCESRTSVIIPGVIAFAPRPSWRGSALAPLLRTIALCVIVALAVQIGECALDACGECVAHHSSAGHEATTPTAGACHNCICVGASALSAVGVLPPHSVVSAVVDPSVAVVEAYPGEPFLPPRRRA